MDPSVISVEIPTVLLMGPCALLCAYGTFYCRPWRHLLVTFVCVIELIGGWYTFAPGQCTQLLQRLYGGATRPPFASCVV